MGKDFTSFNSSNWHELGHYFVHVHCTCGDLGSNVTIQVDDPTGLSLFDLEWICLFCILAGWQRCSPQSRPDPSTMPNYFLCMEMYLNPKHPQEQQASKFIDMHLRICVLPLEHHKKSSLTLQFTVQSSWPILPLTKFSAVLP